jgi:hypothetical protein
MEHGGNDLTNGTVNDVVERDQYIDVNNNLLAHNRPWAQQDATRNVTSVVDDNGSVAERTLEASKKRG